MEENLKNDILYVFNGKLHSTIQLRSYQTIEIYIEFTRQSHLHDSPTINLMGVILH